MISFGIDSLIAYALAEASYSSAVAAVSVSISEEGASSLLAVTSSMFSSIFGIEKETSNLIDFSNWLNFARNYKVEEV